MSVNCAKNVCQFCDKNPGYLQGFAKGWACNTCLFEYGLLDHPMLTDEVQLGGEDNYLDDEHRWFEYGECGYGWENYHQPRLKPKKVKVVVEELECDPSDLRSATHYVYTQRDAPKAVAKPGKWQVDIWY